MKVKILKDFLIIGKRAHNKGDIVDVDYDDETKKRLLKSGHVAPIFRTPDGKPLDAVMLDDEDDDDEDDEDRAPIEKPTRATPRQPRPRYRKPIGADLVADDDDEDDSAGK